MLHFVCMRLAREAPVLACSRALRAARSVRRGQLAGAGGAEPLVAALRELEGVHHHNFGRFNPLEQQLRDAVAGLDFKVVDAVVDDDDAYGTAVVL